MSLGLSSGWRCSMGIAGGRVAWVRRVLGIADQGVVIRIGEQGVAWVAPCHWDC